jgi:nicotinate dehydrogenase subunit B
MRAPVTREVSRREFIASAGALVVSFALVPHLVRAQQPAAPGGGIALPGSLKDAPLLDSWIRVDADGGITVFTGKAELGQGIRTALIQVAAEELVVEPGRIRLVTADTGRTPDEGYTAGSQSMQNSGTAIQNAAAQVRAVLVRLAAERLKVPASELEARNGSVRASDGRSVSYGELVSAETLHVTAEPRSPIRDPQKRAVIGQSMQRVDIPAKVTGGVSYVHDLRLPGTVHARVVRAPSYGARLKTLGVADVERMPGFLKIIRDGSFVAVIAAHEYEAVRAMRALAKATTWEENAALPAQTDLYAYLRRLPSEDTVIFGNAAPPIVGAGTIEASYRRPYQMHAAIGPSCAVGLFQDGQVTVWTHSQGVYPLRGAIAEMLRIAKDRVRCIHMEGSGCYGHNGADDVAAEAALIASAFPGRPVRLQWMREDEHTWEPYGSAMVSAAKARVDSGGNVVDWLYEVWSSTHSSRPGPAGNLVAARQLESPFIPPPPEAIPQPTGGGDRNAIPLYKFANARVVHHFIPAMPLRVSALRALGAYMNVFSIESFMDELASAASTDPVEFRLRHLQDERAREVARLAAARFGWAGYEKRAGRGRGFAFARYKNLAAYLAIALEVEVDRESGRVAVVRVVAAVDSGEAVNPDGIRNQIEGGIIQALSWSLYESVTFDARRITSVDWSTYPILRFRELPDSVDVHVVSRPGQPFLGTGEASHGPTAAALGNAVADATGVRIRELPFTSSRVKAALGV